MPLTVITGANSGIAHAWSKILLEEGHEVIACDVNDAEGLTELRHAGATTMKLDVTKSESIQQLKQAIEDRPLDNLLNIAGIMLGHDKDALETCDLSVLEKTFAVNTYGPFLLTQALLPNLLQAKNAKVGMMSSRVGSIQDNSSGGLYAYRASKTALNSLSKTLALELKDKGVAVILLHPGFVITALDPTNVNQKDALMPDEAAARLWKLFQEKGVAHTGQWFHRDGFDLPW